MKRKIVIHKSGKYDLINIVHWTPEILKEIVKRLQNLGRDYFWDEEMQAVCISRTPEEEQTDRERFHREYPWSVNM